MLRPQLTKLDSWVVEWDVDEEDQRKLFLQIADVAEDAGEEEYLFLDALMDRILTPQ
jgi:translation initiation factor 3 subunit M